MILTYVKIYLFPYVNDILFVKLHIFHIIQLFDLSTLKQCCIKTVCYSYRNGNSEDTVSTGSYTSTDEYAVDGPEINSELTCNTPSTSSAVSAIDTTNRSYNKVCIKDGLQYVINTLSSVAKDGNY